MWNRTSGEQRLLGEWEVAMDTPSELWQPPLDGNEP